MVYMNWQCKSQCKSQAVKYLLCVIDVLIKYAWMKPLKDKKSKTRVHGFIEILTVSNCKSNKLWVAQGKEFYNSPT